jgi:hypothetical protein
MKIREDLTKADIDKGVKVYMDGSEFKNKIEKIVKDKIKNDKDLEGMVVDITKNVITQLYKILWTKKGFWASSIKNVQN